MVLPTAVGIESRPEDSAGAGIWVRLPNTEDILLDPEEGPLLEHAAYCGRAPEISVRVTAEERDLSLAAAGEGPLANWMRTTLTEAARALVRAKP